MTQDSSTTLQTVIDEFRNISPEVSKAFIFRKDGEVVANAGDSIDWERARKVGAAFDEVADKAAIIGGMEILSIQGVDTRLQITSTNSLYVATVASRAADEKLVKTLTCVMVPTVIKLLEYADHVSADNQEIRSETTAGESFKAAVQPNNESYAEQESTVETESDEQELPKPPVNQFMVKKIRGLLVPSDIVRVDAEVVAKWHELYGSREIPLLHIETLEGKSATYKFRPVNESAGSVKGIIHVPEKIMQALRINEGKLVLVKPFVPSDKER